MSILVYIDSQEGKIKKSTLEAASYGSALAGQLGTVAIALILGPVVQEDIRILGKCGVTRILHDPTDKLDRFDSGVISSVIQETSRREKADILVFSHNFHGKALAPLVAAGLQGGIVTGVIALPETGTGFIVKKNVFSGKAFAFVRIKSAIKTLTLLPNAYPISETGGDIAVQIFDSGITETDFRVKVTATEIEKGEIPLAEAEIIVSGGRGLKGPENWGIVQDLAEALGAATACSRPVADSGWRPHHEHVGQTGLTVRPNLYIAIGISGAIQHLAGVNGSKLIVVINKDPEAPFFKAADYGIVGDAFQVVPQLTAAIKKLKG